MFRRIIVPALGLALLCGGCKSNSAENKNIDTDSAVLKIKVDEEKLSKKEITGYHTKLNSVFDSNLLNGRFNGAILIAKGGNILYERYIGYADVKNKKDTITENTAFHLASTSKPFTAIGILKLVDEGKVNLNDDVIKYFSGFPYSGVTVKDLLSHRSGLPNYLYFMEDKKKWPANKMVSNADVLDFLIKHQPALNYKPGTHFSYCNTNYVLLALIIEKVTGQNYPAYLNKAIFKPLQMNHTFVYTPADSGKVVASYKPSGALWQQDIFDNTYGDKNIYSTPQDMYKWDRALYSKKFINSTLLDSAFMPLSLEVPSIHNYGLGWRMLNLDNGKNVIYHFGKWHGFTPAFARLLDEKAVIIILGNQYNQRIYSAAKLCYNVFGEYLQATPPDVKESTQPTGPTEEDEAKVANATKNVEPSPRDKKKVKPKTTPQKKVVAPKPVAKKSTIKKSVKKK